MTIDEYFGDWMSVIDRQELNNIMSKLSIEYKRKPICPNQSNVFKAFKLCPFKDLRAVFIGMDPYPDKFMGKPRATGILFGNSKDTPNDKLSPSLQIVKEAVINFEVPHYCITFDPSLENWARQGILMLNSALTVEMNKTGSHIMLWRLFISKLLKNLSDYDTGMVYVLFGRQAQTFKPYINEKFNHVFEIEHPAYFARNSKKMPHELFINISNTIEGINGVPIEWYSKY